MNTIDTLESIFTDARRMPPSQRAAFLDDACQGDIAVRRQIEALLQSDAKAGSFLEAPPSAIALAGPDTTEDYHAPTERPGDRIGRYKLLQQIGEGGFGVVYMAEQERPVRRKVALKIIKPGMDTKEVIARFESERQALALMDHPNIAKVLDAGATESGRPYFVMELVRGLPITQYCDEQKVPLDQLLKLFIDVCHAVQHAHQKGIIHRDIKPTNVMVTPHDGRPVPKVIDFGIAKATSQQLTDKTLFTAYGQMIGTPAYMSPEQAELNALDVDTRSDVYSLGVLLYELLTGTTPFDAKTLRAAGFDEMRRIIREEEPETVSARIARTRRASCQLAANSSRHAPRDAAPRGIGVSPVHRGAGVSPAQKNAPAPTSDTAPHASTNHDTPTPATSTSPQPSRVSFLQHSSFSLQNFRELDWIVSRSLEKDRNRRYESASALAADIQRYLSDEPVQACPPSTAYRFRKFARKHRAVFTTAALAAFALLLGTALSTWQAIRATAAEAQATDAVQAENKQRVLAERNYEAALEAVNRMLANVNDPELNDFPRVGPLHRKLLKDAIGFYERIPDQAGLAPEVRFRMAKVWFSAAVISQELLESELANASYAKAIKVLSKVSAERPDEDKYLVALAEYQTAAGMFHGDQNIQESRKFHLQASEIYEGLAKKHPQDRIWIVKQAHSFVVLGGGAGGDTRIRKDEYQRRASDLLDLVNASEYERMTLTRLRAWRTWRIDVVESDKLFVRSQNAFREHIASGAASDSERKEFARVLRSNSARGEVINTVTNAPIRSFYVRFPEAAAAQIDESIAVYRKVFAQSPRTRPSPLIEALSGQAYMLRRRAAGYAGEVDRDQRTALEAKAETLHRDAITLQRNMVTRHVIDSDRFQLVKMLQVECEHLLKRIKVESANEQERKVEADAFLTEAIQQCRFLSTDRPDNTEYRDRLAALLQLQVPFLADSGKVDEARQIVRQMSPLTSVEYLARGDLYEVLRDSSAALADFERAVELDPKNSTAITKLARLADAFTLQGSFAEAERLNRLLISSAQQHGQTTTLAGSYHSLAWMLKRAGRTNEAIDSARKAVDLLEGELKNSPDSALAGIDMAKSRQLFGDVLRKAGRSDEAVICLQRGIEVLQQPFFGSQYVDDRLRWLNELQFSLAYAYRELKNPDEALRVAATITPTLSAGYLRRGQLYESLGNSMSAITDYQKALELDPANTKAQEELARIKSKQPDSQKKVP